MRTRAPRLTTAIPMAAVPAAGLPRCPASQCFSGMEECDILQAVGPIPHVLSIYQRTTAITSLNNIFSFFSFFLPNNHNPKTDAASISSDRNDLSRHLNPTQTLCSPPPVFQHDMKS